MAQRDQSLDLLRGIAILFVVFGHIQRLEGVVTDYIWSFHLPLFFFISGMLYSEHKYADFRIFVKRKVSGIILPYIFFYLITYIYWVCIERHMRGGEIPVLQYLAGLVYGTYNARFNDFNGPLWFLPALFTVELIYYWVAKLRSRSIVILALVLLFAVGYLFSDYLHVLPLGINAALLSVCFYGFGHLFVCSGVYAKVRELKKWILLPAAALLAGAHYALLPWTGVELCLSRIDHPLLFVPVAMIGISVYLLLAQAIKHNRALEWMGRSSLVIFAFHGQIFRVVLYAESKIAGMEVTDVRQSVLLCGICLLVTVAVIWPLNCWYNRFVAPKF